MNTVKDSQQPKEKAEAKKIRSLADKNFSTSQPLNFSGSQAKNSSLVPRPSFLKLSVLRRYVMLAIIVLFLLQFFRVKILIGGLTGSLALWFVKLIDIFAYLESFVASREFTTIAFLSVLPIVSLYLVFGKAFCGWVCPMDFLFELVVKLRNKEQGTRVKGQGIWNPKIGYSFAGMFLIASGILGIPIFTNYLSHLTNFFRAISSGVYLTFTFPAEPVVLYFSVAVIFSLLVLEYFSPRLWCVVLCPVGKIYGLFNKISMLRLKIFEGNCGECNLCEHVCYMNVKITPYLDQTSLRDTNCIYCGKCVEGCDTKGKLIKMTLSVTQPQIDTDKHRLKEIKK